MQPESVHLKHALTFLRGQWLYVDRFPASVTGTGVDLFLATPRHPRLLVLVTGGDYQTHQLTRGSDQNALSLLRRLASDRKFDTLHISSLVNALGASEALNMHFHL